MAAASPRVSGFTSVIQLFRWYRSQGYSTLRRTCFFMRKSCKEKRKYFSVDLFYFVFLRYCIHLYYPSFYISYRWREMLHFTIQSQIKLVYDFIIWEINIIYLSVDRVSLLVPFFRMFSLKKKKRKVQKRLLINLNCSQIIHLWHIHVSVKAAWRSFLFH